MSTFTALIAIKTADGYLWDYTHPMPPHTSSSFERARERAELIRIGRKYQRPDHHVVVVAGHRVDHWKPLTGVLHVR